AVDDFGAGNAGLGLLADFQTTIVKLDMGLIRNIHLDKSRQVIVKNVITMLRELNTIPLAEGIEVIEEMQWLRDSGVELL
ncbi:MAG: EAL domain-containing protein, partial [Oleibacter sp.]|nr:EAL domain-containing protein [Thalassolituus sp.]